MSLADRKDEIWSVIRTFGEDSLEMCDLWFRLPRWRRRRRSA